MSDAASNSTAAPFGDRSNRRTREEQGDGESKDSGAGQPLQSSACAVTRLYRHALESIFAFMSLADLSRVLSVSRFWSSAVRSMTSIGAAVDRPAIRPSVIAASGLASQVAEFGSFSVRLVLNSHDLLALSRLPSLTALSCTVPLPQPPLVFSHKLHRLSLEFKGSWKALRSIHAAFLAIGELPALESLCIRLPSYLYALTFAPLAAAPSLRGLRIDQDDRDAQPTAAQIDQLRSFAHLESITIPELSNASWDSLLRTPHQLQWQHVGQLTDVDEIGSAALSCLPGLTSLIANKCRTVAFLHTLPRLRTLDLGVSSAFPADTIVAGLSCCSELVSLSLRARVTSTHMHTILSVLPLLTDVTLHDCPELESLSFFETVDWTCRPGLQCLCIDYECRRGRVPVDSVSSLFCLRGLTYLTLVNAFVSPLPDETVHALRPPSELFPSLKELDYEHDGPSYAWDELISP